MNHQRHTHTYTHSQDNGCGDECTPVEGSSATVNRGCLLLVHLPTTVATAATARQEEPDDRHQNDVQDADGYAYKEPHVIDQELMEEGQWNVSWGRMLQAVFQNDWNYILLEWLDSIWCVCTLSEVKRFQVWISLYHREKGFDLTRGWWQGRGKVSVWNL